MAMKDNRPYPTRMGQQMFPGQMQQPGMAPPGGMFDPNMGMGMNLGMALMPPPPAIAQPDPTVTPPPQAGSGIMDKLKGLGGGIGGALSGAANWLTDKDQGYLRQLLLMNALGAGASIYGANKQGAIADEERRREERVRRSYGRRG